MSEQTPSISIDDALQLFLQLVGAGGLPDGPEKDALLEHMRARVAADRPQWAEASAPPPAPASPLEAKSEYAQTKAAIVAAAQASEIPIDPMERAMWEERQQARRNAEQRRADASEAEARERLRRRAIDEQHELDEVTLERALRIRRVLALKLEALTPARAPEPDLGASSIEFSPAPSPAEPASISFSVEERVEMMRAHNAERRALLKHREDVIGRRGADHRSDADERMTMAPREVAREREALAIEARAGKRKRTWDLQLD